MSVFGVVAFEVGLSFSCLSCFFILLFFFFNFGGFFGYL